jgi:hypothetical protein
LPGRLKEARLHGDLKSPSLYVYPGVLVHLARDRVEAARQLLQEIARERPAGAFDLRDVTVLHCASIIDRYEGQPRVAWQRISELWEDIERSKILVVNIVRITLLAERGTAALAMAADGGEDAASYVRLARQCAKRLLREKLRHARPLAGLLRARIARILGDGPRALAELTNASLELETAGLASQAQCARRAIGSLMQGSIGASLVTETDAALRQQGIVNPMRFVELMAPGFLPAGPAAPSDSRR